MDKLVRNLIRMTEGVVQVVCGRSIRVKADPNPNRLGCTDGKMIYIGYAHKLFEDKADVQRAAISNGVGFHEAGHNLYTDFLISKKVAEDTSLSDFRKKFLLMLNNIMEDSAIEYFGRQEYPGDPTRCLNYVNRLVYESSPPLEEAKTKISQVINAFIQYGDVGRYKGEFTFPEAKKAFMQCVPYLDQCTVEPVPSKRFKLVRKVYDILSPLLDEEEEKFKKNQKLLEELLKALEDAFVKGLLDTNLDKRPSGRPPTGNPLDDPLMKARRKFIVVVRKKSSEAGEDGEELPEDAEVLDLGGDSDIEDGDEKNEKGGGSGSNKKNKNDDGDKGSGKGSGSDGEDSGSDGDGSSPDSESGKDSKGSSSGKEDKDGGSQKDGGDSDGEDAKNQSQDGDSKDDGDKSSSEGKDNVRAGDNRSRNKKGSRPKGDTSMAEDREDSDSGIHEETNEEFKDLFGRLQEELDRTDSEEDRSEAREEMSKAELERELNSNFTDPNAIHRHVRNYVVHVTRDDEEAKELYTELMEPIRMAITVLTKKLSEMLRNPTDKRRTKVGTLDVRRALTKPTAVDVFTKHRKIKEDAELAVMLLIDESGSMHCNNRYAYARQAAILVYEVCTALGVPISIIGFTTSYNGVHHRHFVMFGSKRKAEKYGLVEIDHHNSNRDGYSIRYAASILAKRKEPRKLLLVISDGAPADQNYGGMAAMQDTHSAVLESERKDIRVIGIGLNTDATVDAALRSIYPNYVEAKKVSELPVRLAKLIERQLTKR